MEYLGYKCCFTPFRGFPGGSEDKESACNAGYPGSILGLGRPPGEGNGNPLQYFCLGNSTDRGAWWATIHGITKELDTTEQLNNTTTYDEGQASSAEVQILNSKKSQTATGNPKGMMLYLEVNDVWGLGLTRR